MVVRPKRNTERQRVSDRERGRERDRQPKKLRAHKERSKHAIDSKSKSFSQSLLLSTERQNPQWQRSNNNKQAVQGSLLSMQVVAVVFSTALTCCIVCGKVKLL